MEPQTATRPRPPLGGPIALIIQPDGAAVLTHLPVHPAAQLLALNEAVGGYLEAVATANSDWVAYINEEGKGQRLPPNLGADVLVRALGWQFQPGDYIVGPAVFLGRDGVDEADCPQHVIELARQAGILTAPPNGAP